MTKLSRAAAAAAALATALLLSSGTTPAEAAAKAPTKAKLSFTDGVIKVKVTSDREACERNRVVVLYVVGADDSVESEAVRTNDRGVFRVNGTPPPGRLTAVVPRTARCGIAQSNTVRIPGTS